MANANTAVELSLPETESVSKRLMRDDASHRMLLKVKILHLRTTAPVGQAPYPEPRAWR